MFKIIAAVISNKSLLIPKYRLNNVSEINSIKELIHNKQKKIFIFDKDDTLVTLHQFTVIDLQTIKLLENLKEKGKKVYVVSNSIKDKNLKVSYSNQNKVQNFVPILHTTLKKPYNIKQIKQIIQNDQQNIKNGVKVNHLSTVIVGDRLLTDIVLGNMEGWTTVLVKPVQQTSIKKHGVGVFIMRRFENLLLNFL